MVAIASRVLKGVTAGDAIGADELGRYLSPEQRATLIERLTNAASDRADALVADARAVAAAILADAEAQAASIRDTARREGFDAGRGEGYTTGLSEAEPIAQFLREAAEGAEQVRSLLLEGVEEQAISLVVAAARRIVGTVADRHAGLAAEIVRTGIRSTPARVVRVRVNPRDVHPVTASLVEQGKSVDVVPEAAIEVGGCIIDLESGTIDLRLSTQMASVERTFLGADD
jgi:flagellar assembly protein FliH